MINTTHILKVKTFYCFSLISGILLGSLLNFPALGMDAQDDPQEKVITLKSQTNSTSKSINDLPDETLLSIFRFLPLKTLSGVAAVAWWWTDVSADHSLWKIYIPKVRDVFPMSEEENSTSFKQSYVNRLYTIHNMIEDPKNRTYAHFLREEEVMRMRTKYYKPFLVPDTQKYFLRSLVCSFLDTTYKNGFEKEISITNTIKSILNISFDNNFNNISRFDKLIIINNTMAPEIEMNTILNLALEENLEKGEQ